VSNSNRTFRPNFRVVVDVLLIFNVFLFVVYALLQVDFTFLLIAGLIVNSLFILIWFLVISPIVTVQIFQNEITGPSLLFKRKSLTIRSIDHNRLYSTGNPRKSFVKDLWTVDGQRIRLYRKFLGEGKVGTIISIIEKYPFREKTS
jgi:hypothetical protein